jgi:predicted MPP superfamily phosphohydrolase
MFVFSLLLSFISAYASYDWAVRCLPWLDARRRGFAVALGALCTVPMPLGWLVVYRHSRLAAEVQGALTVLLVTMALVAIPLGLLRLGGWVRSRLGADARSPAASATGSVLRRRQVVEAAAGMALFGATGSMIGWGIVRGRHAFELFEVAVRIPGLPRVLDGYAIVQVSDIHTGLYVGNRELDEGIALVRRARPDLIALTGDVVDFEPELAGPTGRRLAEVAGRDGVVAVLGNHDYYAGSQSVRRGLQAAGVDTLVNRGRVLRPEDGGGFALLGVDDRHSPRYGGAGPRLDLALAMVPPDRPRVLLSHQPPTVDGWAGQVALQLSGHTHGGQINPASRLLNPFFKYLAGAYLVRGTTLYVNRGFGTVGPPSRVGAPPEVTRIVLVSA